MKLFKFVLLFDSDKVISDPILVVRLDASHVFFLLQQKTNWQVEAEFTIRYIFLGQGATSLVGQLIIFQDKQKELEMYG